MPYTLQSPLSLYSIPIVWFTTFYPMNMKFALIDKYKGYDNVQPRSNTRRLAESGVVPPAVAARAERLEGAHLNGNEILPMWAAAVLAGNFAGISNETLNKASATFIGLRVLYNHIYINQTTQAFSWLRTVVWLSSMGVPIYILIKAANAVNAMSLP